MVVLIRQKKPNQHYWAAKNIVLIYRKMPNQHYGCGKSLFSFDKIMK